MPYRWSLPLLLVPACFAPHDPIIATGDGSTESGDESGDTSTGATATTLGESESSAATTTTAPDTSTSEADTTAGDAPPELSSFSVNGSEMPSEILEADMVEIQVAVEDDVGVALVEFFDGDTLIASFTEPPYHTQYLVTSADNGGHSFTAVAHDTADQTAEAGPIPLSISIDGGAIVALQDVGFDGFDTLFFNPPRVLVRDDELLLYAASEYHGAGFDKVRIAVSSYSFGLSEVWASNFPVTPTVGGSHYQTMGRGGVDTDGDLLLCAQVGTSYAGGEPTSVYRAAESSGQVASELALGASTNAGLAIAPDLDVIVATGLAEISRYDASLSDVEWSTNVAAGLGTSPSVMNISVDSTGAVLLDGVEENAKVSFLRKLSADGDILWTREIDENLGSSEIAFAWSAVAPDDSVTQVIARSESSSQGIRMITYDASGTEASDVVVADGTLLWPHAVVYDPTGRVVIAATRVTGTGDLRAWAGRFAPDGAEIWSDSLAVGSGDTSISDVVVTAEGRLFGVGRTDIVAVGFLSRVGPAWIAELGL